jgi:hypothetical protein
MAAQLGRKEAVPSRTEGIPSCAEGNPSWTEGFPSWTEGFPSRAEGNPNVHPSVKSKSFNGLRSMPAGGLGVAPESRARPINLTFCGRRRLKEGRFDPVMGSLYQTLLIYGIDCRTKISVFP